MIKLTRLNHHVVGVNPDTILWADATPDTTLCIQGGEKLLVRESLDELIQKIILYQRMIHEPVPEGAIILPSSQTAEGAGDLNSASGPPSRTAERPVSARFQRPDVESPVTRNPRREER
jgi:flagellar protein FlbD